MLLLTLTLMTLMTTTSASTCVMMFLMRSVLSVCQFTRVIVSCYFNGMESINKVSVIMIRAKCISIMIFFA